MTHARTRLADVQATRPYREADGKKNGAAWGPAGGCGRGAGIVRVLPGGTGLVELLI
jgi:hypothetical protein